MLKTNERAPSPAPTARVTYRAALAKDAADQAEVFYHAVMQGANPARASGFASAQGR